MAERDDVPISEPVYVPDTFVTGMARMSQADGNWRLSFFADRAAIGISPRERIVVCHLVMSEETQRGIIRDLLLARNRELNSLVGFLAAAAAPLHELFAACLV